MFGLAARQKLLKGGPPLEPGRPGMPAGGGRDAPLAVQAEQLKKAQARRAERRRAARGRSLAARGRDGEPPAAGGAGEARKVWGGATGGVNLGAGAGLRALPEATNIIHCELCGISVASRAEWQQHVTGVAHRKALERQRAEQAGASGPGAAAQAALEAAAWAAGAQEGPAAGLTRRVPPSGTAAEPAAAQGRPGAPPGGEHREVQGRAGKPNSRGERKGMGDALGRRGSGQDGQPSSGLKLSHAELVRQAAAKSRAGGEPLSLGGWVPPSIPLPQQPSNLGEGAEAEGGGGVNEAKGANSVSGDSAGREPGGLLGLGDYTSDSDSSALPRDPPASFF